MAGGIDWFRWHHGSVTDPKFALIAKKAGARLGDVLAVWAYVLEAASAATERGQFGAIDCEAVDCMLDMNEGATAAILAAMDVRGLTRGDAVASWDKRQPKREDDTAAERKRRQREREHEVAISSAVTATESPSVTQGHADVTHGHDRGEESREEEIQEPTVLVGKPASRPPDCPTFELIGLYHEHLPMLPRVEVVSDTRKRALSARWRDVVTDPDIRKSPDVRAAGLDWFAWFFGHCAKSRFLTGKAKDWRADLDFLLSPNKFAKAVEGSYHKEAA